MRIESISDISTDYLNVKRRLAYHSRNLDILQGLNCGEHEISTKDYVTHFFCDYYSVDSNEGPPRYIDEIFSIGKIRDREFSLTTRAYPVVYLSPDDFMCLENQPASSENIKGYFILLQELKNNEPIEQRAVLLRSKDKKKVKQVHEKILSKVCSTLSRQEKSINDCINWILSDTEYACLIVQAFDNKDFECKQANKPVIYSMYKHMQEPDSTYTSVGLRVINGKNNQDAIKYLLTCTNLESSLNCLINTSDFNLANQVFNSVVHELEEEPHLLPNEVLSWLASDSQYHSLCKLC